MITFSGIDCSGKSTQLDLIKTELEKKGIKSRMIWSRGGYTPWIEAFKNLVRRETVYEGNGISDSKTVCGSSSKARLLLWASICDLIRYYGIVYRFIEWSGTLILCDRYIWDTYVDFKIKYAGVVFEKWLCWRIMLKLIKKPDCSIIFTIPAEESMRRSNLKNDKHSEPEEIRRNRIAMYENLVKNGNWQYVIDAQENIETVHKQVNFVIDESKALDKWHGVIE